MGDLSSWSASNFMPHGYCMMWRQDLVWLHVTSDAAIAVAYFSIPLTLGHFARKRPDFPFAWLLKAFAAFIFACAATHVFGIVTLWYPVYGIEGVVKALTAAVSLATAVGLVWIAPHALALRSPSELEALNRSLRDQIAERTKAEQALARARDELETRVKERTRELADKNAELEQLVYTVSHDLKSPLVTISGFANRLDGHLQNGSTEKADDALRRIRGAALRMGTLLNNLLELSRVGRRTKPPEEVDVTALVRELAADLRPRLQEAGVSLEVQDGLPQVWADRSTVLQLFENLITNAVKYGQLDGQPGRIVVGGRQEKLQTLFFVRDSGPGIAEQYHHRIFQLFQRLDTNQEGTGLGLAIVAKIMALQQGRAWVESKCGEGATFWLAFPRAAGRATPALPAAGQRVSE